MSDADSGGPKKDALFPTTFVTKGVYERKKKKHANVHCVVGFLETKCFLIKCSVFESLF